MSTWLDYSFARPDLHAAKAQGAAGVIRYLCPVNPQSQGKILTAPERDQILGAGLDLVLNFEWYEGRCNEGAKAGQQDATVAMEQAHELGYPGHASIYFSHDTGTNDLAAIDDYFGAVAGTMTAWDCSGYSGFTVIKHLLDSKLIKYGWQTRAWSNGARDPRAVLFQDGNYWFGNGADENNATAFVDSWLQQAGAPVANPVHPVAPAPKPKPAPHPVALPGNRVYAVKSGDTLSVIATRFNTTVATLVSRNHIANPNLILPGQLIYLDFAGPAVAKPSTPPAGTTYTVQAGDNLTTIARRYPQAWITPASIAALNRLADPNLIKVGQVLRIG